MKENECEDYLEFLYKVKEDISSKYASLKECFEDLLKYQKEHYANWNVQGELSTT